MSPQPIPTTSELAHKYVEYDRAKAETCNQLIQLTNAMVKDDQMTFVYYYSHLFYFAELLIETRAFIPTVEYLGLEAAMKPRIAMVQKANYDFQTIMTFIVDLANFINYIYDHFGFDFNHILYLDEADAARQKFLAGLN